MSPAASRPRRIRPRNAVSVIAIVATLIGVGTSPVVAKTQVNDYEYLIRSEAARSEDGMEVVRDVGFGWTLVSSKTPLAANDLTGGFSSSSATPAVFPNTTFELLEDPLFGDQWALENTGQDGGTAGSDIDAPGAWALTTGTGSVVVAVLDSGVDLDHPDLAGRVWVNTGEIPGNGIDDDNNGYVDDVHGWDMFDQDASPQDQFGHGTMTTGIIAASLNGVGTVGVAPEVTIMPIRVCDTSCPLSAIVEGMQYALDNGARIINFSLGSHTENPALEDAVATADALGAVLVAAAGNGGADNDTWPMYPASYPFDNVISVAATDRNDGLASGSGWASNFGDSSVDIGAPGKDVLTTQLGGDWTLGSGTSFAAPHVSGAVALVRTVRPLASPSEVSSFIFETADQVAALAGKTVTGGRLDAGAALWAASTPVAVASADPSSGAYPFTVRLDASGSYDPRGKPLSFSWSLPGGVTETGVSVEWAISEPGTHEAVLTVTNSDGLHSNSTVTVASNAAPVARASADPTLGWEPLDIALSADGSHDPDGQIVAWNWTGPHVTATGETATMTIRTVGEHSIELTVTDDFGAHARDSVSVLVGTDFIDTRSSIFRLDVAWMSALGITRGCNPPDNDRYCPTNPVTREQMAAFLTRALHLPPTTTDFFTDDAGSVFEDDINRLAAAGITKGCNPPGNDRYCPTNPVTRGQMAAFLHRSDPAN